jgi:hypothetical protein
MEVIVHALVLVPFVLLSSAVVLGQIASHDEKPKDAKEIAVQYMLGEPDRLLAEFSKSRDRVTEAKAASFFGNRATKAAAVATLEKERAAFEKKLDGVKNGDIPTPNSWLVSRKLRQEAIGSLPGVLTASSLATWEQLRFPAMKAIRKSTPRFSKLSIRTKCF